MEFFTTATGNLLEAARSADVKHYVVLSVVGTGEVPDSGYLRAKAAQEELVAVSGVPYTIVRATQFFEFLPRMADDSVVDGKVHLPPVHFQPMSSDDVARAVAETAVAGALRGIREVGGPQRVRMDELVAEALRTGGDSREVVADPRATYFGAELDDDVLVPGPRAALSTTSYAEWLLASR
jgi:uncharacterized protein YbjT (DUF2867 family)